MSLNLKTLALAREIETAFKNHLGTDSFPTEEWPAVALAFAKVIERTGDLTQASYTAGMDSAAVREFVESLSTLNNAIADLVGL